MSQPESAPGGTEAAERRRRFHALFDGEFDYVWATLRRLGVHTRDLEDVAQDVFIHVYRRFDLYQPSRPVRPWLFAFAFRCASDWRRLARHRFEVLDNTDKHASTALAADDALTGAGDDRLVQAALDHVPVERRAVLVLHDFDEVPAKEISVSLGIPLFTTYSRLRIARQEFTEAARRLRARRGDP